MELSHFHFRVESWSASTASTSRATRWTMRATWTRTLSPASPAGSASAKSSIRRSTASTWKFTILLSSSLNRHQILNNNNSSSNNNNNNLLSRNNHSQSQVLVKVLIRICFRRRRCSTSFRRIREDRPLIWFTRCRIILIKTISWTRRKSLNQSLTESSRTTQLFLLKHYL